MKLVCINSEISRGGHPCHDYITEGKVYEMIPHKDDIHIPSGLRLVYIISDNGEKISLREDGFRPLDEVRLEKIEEILK